MFGSDFWFIVKLIMVIARALLAMDPKDGDNPINGKG